MRGVSWNVTNQRWRASLGQKYLGEFVDFEAACRARREAEIARFGRPQEDASIRVSGGEAFIPIFNRAGEIEVWSAIEVQDLRLVQDHRWCRTRSGYAVARVDGKIVYLHRLLIPEAAVVDHRDRDRMNNRRSNLRPCTPAENSRNATIGCNNRSGFKGVSVTRDAKWRARIMINRRELWLGAFNTREEARAAYDAAALRIHGEFASPNGDRPELRIVVREAVRTAA